MPDAHWGYGFPIGGVAAFDPATGGVVSAGGVGFDISCGVRCLVTGMRAEDLVPIATSLADELFATIPAGVGSTGNVRLRAASSTRCSPAGRGGRSVAVTEPTPTSTGSRSAARCCAPDRARCQRARSSGSATRWARSARAITTSKSIA